MTVLIERSLTNEIIRKIERRTANSTYPKVAVQWLNQALCPPPADFCLVDSEVLLNPRLRVAANRCMQFEKRQD
ncbi:MAG: hypothetical protein SF052_04250 [Bacteroidia bacterium]|nr:hypothetical protein [Bacteroidia bacterium]